MNDNRSTQITNHWQASTSECYPKPACDFLNLCSFDRHASVSDKKNTPMNEITKHDGTAIGKNLASNAQNYHMNYRQQIRNGRLVASIPDFMQSIKFYHFFKKYHFTILLTKKGFMHCPRIPLIKTANILLKHA